MFAEFRRPEVGQALALEGLMLQLLATLARADAPGSGPPRDGDGLYVAPDRRIAIW